MVPLAQESGFLVGKLDVGNSKDLSLIIDTEYQDIYVDPGLYKPTYQSNNLDMPDSKPAKWAFGDTTNLAGFDYGVYSDVVLVQGLEVTDQKFGYASGNTTVGYPLQETVGLLGGNRSTQSFSGTPFFLNLCEQKQIEDYRFGLTLTSPTNGSLILGGPSDEPLHGELNTAPIADGHTWGVAGKVIVNEIVVATSQSLQISAADAGVG